MISNIKGDIIIIIIISIIIIIIIKISQPCGKNKIVIPTSTSPTENRRTN